MKGSCKLYCLALPPSLLCKEIWINASGPLAIMEGKVLLVLSTLYFGLHLHSYAMHSPIHYVLTLCSILNGEVKGRNKISKKNIDEFLYSKT